MAHIATVAHIATADRTATAATGHTAAAATAITTAVAAAVTAEADVAAVPADVIEIFSIESVYLQSCYDSIRDIEYYEKEDFDSVGGWYAADTFCPGGDKCLSGFAE